MNISETPILADLHARLTLPEKLWLLAKIYYWKFIGIFETVGRWWTDPPKVTSIITDPKEVKWWYESGQVSREEFEVEKTTAYAAFGLPAPTPENQHIYTNQFRTSCTYYTGPMPTSSYYTIRPQYLHTVKRENEVYIPDEGELFSRFGFKQED